MRRLRRIDDIQPGTTRRLVLSHIFLGKEHMLDPQEDFIFAKVGRFRRLSVWAPLSPEEFFFLSQGIAQKAQRPSSIHFELTCCFRDRRLLSKGCDREGGGGFANIYHRRFS